MNFISSAVLFNSPFKTSITNASVALVPIDKLVSALLASSKIVMSPVEVIAPHPNVPVVDRFSLPKLIAPLESVILPSANVRFPTVEPLSAEIVDEKLPVPVTVKFPDANVPVVDRFSLPKLIAPLESVILPSANVKFPTEEPVAAVKTPHPNVPVVNRFSSPKLIAPLESVILPSASVRFPTVEPLSAEIVDEKLPVPVTVKLPDANVPVVERFSLSKVIAPLESVILPLARVKFPTVEPVAAETVDEKLPVPVTVKFPDANVPVVERFSLSKVIAPLESVILPLANVRLPTVEPVAAETVDEKVPVPVILTPLSLISNLFDSSTAKVNLP